MPGLWVHLYENPDFFKSFEVERGAYIEAVLYDERHGEQGKGLWRVSGMDQKTKDGLWVSAKLIAVSDAHLFWWLTEGPGEAMKRAFKLHLCVTPEKECPKCKKKKDNEFHTDYFRSVDAGDVVDGKVSWFKTPPAKDDVETEVAKLTGNAPRGRTRKSRAPAAGHDTGLDWEMSDSDPMDALDTDEGGGVDKKLAALKRQTIGEPDRGREKEKKKKKKDKDSKKEARSDKSRRRDRRSGSQDRDKKDPLWFGQRKADAPRRRRSDDSSSQIGSGSRKNRKKRRSRSPSEKRREKKRRKVDNADRGPYGVGQKQRYDGRSASSATSDRDEDQDESVFRAGPSGTSKHLQLQEYAEKKPGRLTARLLRKMQTILSRSEEGPASLTGQNLTPPAATAYYLTVLVPQYKERMNVRTSRELRSIAKAIDLLAQGKPDRAGDVLSQRYKALELYLSDLTWARAQFLKLIPAEGASLVEKDEVMMASKEQTAEHRMRVTLAQPTWRPSTKGDGKSEEKGKTKGKGKGKKGRGLGQPWNHPAEAEKPPVA